MKSINNIIFEINYFYMVVIDLALKNFIEKNAIGFATVNKDGMPHNIAVADVKVLKDNIIISNLHIKESIENLEFNSIVSLVVWNKNWEKSCVGFELIGIAKNYTNGKWLKFVENLPENRGCKVISAILVKIKKIKKLLS